MDQATVRIATPIEALSTLAGQGGMDLINRAYLARAIVSSLNASRIGYLQTYVRKQMLENPTDGVDEANDELAKALESAFDRETTQDNGFEAPKPDEEAQSIEGCIKAVMEAMDISIEVSVAINRPQSTLKFMSNRNPDDVDKVTAARVAKALEIDIDKAIIGCRVNNHKRHQQFLKLMPQVADMIDLAHPSDMGWYTLSKRGQIRVAQAIEKHLGTKVNNEVQRFIGGNAENMGDIELLKVTLKLVKAWISRNKGHDDLTAILNAA